MIVLTETWLSSKVENREILQCDKKFSFFRCDRGSRSGGGVLIAVSEEFMSFKIPIVCSLELVCVRIRISHKDVIVCACYRPPNAPSGFSNDFHGVLSDLHVRFPATPILILGDFNFPDISWNNSHLSPGSGSSESACFLNTCAQFNLTQLVMCPTRITHSSASTLDLVLTSHPDLVQSLSVLPGLSDHEAIVFNLPCASPRKQKSKKRFRDYSRADYGTINTELEHFTSVFLEDFNQRSVNDNWMLFKNKVAELVNKYIPLREIACNSQSPWFTPTLKRLSNKKKRVYRQAKRSNLSERWEVYKKVADEYGRALSAAKESFLQQTLPLILQNNPHKFWQVVNGGDRKQIELTTDTDEVISSENVCITLNHAFSSFFTNTTPAVLPGVQARDFIVMNSVHVDRAGIRKLIQNLKISSSPGVDGISSKFLKNTDVHSSIILSRLFDQSLEEGVLPEDWKVGKVAPLFKSGNAHSPGNYRPISLTSVPCKLLEHVIYTHVVSYLESNAFFSIHQHGFRKYYSCETQLLAFTNDLFSAADRSSTVDCVFIDFSKAFDTVCHKLLLLKLNALNIDANVLKWIECFLSNRTQFVTANDHCSPTSPVTSGVPQGSVLGPLLFLIYINDLPKDISSSIKLFADDCVIYREIRTNADNLALQTDLDHISSWCDAWLMKLNVTKCKAMRISRCISHNVPCDYTLNHSNLDLVSSYKYLGVYISNNLSWNTHVDYITNNANRTLGYLRRNFSLAPTNLKLLLYQTLVRPKLEYASSVWDPHTNYLADSIEAVQNRSARFVMSNYHRTSSVTSMKANLHLPTLSLRRKISRLCLFHKIFHCIPSFSNTLFQPPSYVSSRNDHQFKVGVPSARTNLYFESFIPKTANEWNHLPAPIAAITDLTLFKNALSNHFA